MIYNDFGVAINVFWKHLPNEFYESRDPYGNKDLVQANKGFDKLNRALKDLEELPEYYRRFYCQRFIEEIRNAFDHE